MHKIMIDLDETIVCGGYVSAMNEYFGTTFQNKDMEDYYTEEVLPEKEKEEYLDYFYKNVNVYDHSTLIPDALEVIEELSHYYEIYICSAFVDSRRPKESSIMSKYKYEWIYQNMPYIDPKKVLLTSAKEIVMCEIKIDDKVSNLKRGYGKIKLLLNQKHNEKFSDAELARLGIKRVYSWKEIRKILIEGEV